MKNRHLFLYFLLAITIAASAGSVHSSQTIYLPLHVVQPINSKNTVFLWDFHDVIAKRNLKETFLMVWNSNKKFAIIRALGLKLFGKLVAMAGRSIVGDVSAEELIQLIKQHNIPEFEKLIIQVANAQGPIAGTVDLIDALHQLGYQHYIGSNIGASVFADIINPSKYPQFASLFENFNLEHPQTVTFDAACPECTLKKPDIRFYQAFAQRNEIDIATTNVIFIDDRVKNVIAAQKAGLIGILFLSPEQLQADLKKLGIFDVSSSPVDFQLHPVV